MLNGKKTAAEHHWDNFLRLSDEDLVRQWRKKSIEVLISTLFQDYETATNILKEMNQEFPEIGNYQWLNAPRYDRIKEEYPPFQEAINALQMPPKLSEIERLKM